MEASKKYLDYGKPTKETYSESVLKLTEQVFKCVTFEYSQGMVYDTIEAIIKDQINHDDIFICSQDNIESKILAVHDVADDPIISLFIGPYMQYRKTVLEKFSQKISAIIYKTGMKEEIIKIMFAILLKEMKIRFSNKKSGYVYAGVEGNREEGVIRLR